MVDGNVTLSDILVFCTGADVVPYGGFEKDPTISFDHDKLEAYQQGWFWANTCAMELTLPTKSENYISFRTSLIAVIENTQFFDAQ